MLSVVVSDAVSDANHDVGPVEGSAPDITYGSPAAIVGWPSVGSPLDGGAGSGIGGTPGAAPIVF